MLASQNFGPRQPLSNFSPDHFHSPVELINVPFFSGEYGPAAKHLLWQYRFSDVGPTRASVTCVAPYAVDFHLFAPYEANPEFILKSELLQCFSSLLLGLFIILLPKKCV